MSQKKESIRMRAALFLALALFSTAALADDDNSISTDRPGFTNGPDVVGKGRIQLETGLYWDRDSGVRDRATPTLLRLGVIDSFELRLSSNGRQSTSQGGSSVSGWGGLQLGAKWHISDGNEAGAPAMAWILTVAPPNGSTAFRGNKTRTELDLPLSWNLPGGFGLGLMPGLIRDHDDSGQGGWAEAISVNVGHEVAKDVQGFVELAAQQLAADRLGGNMLTATVGASWKPGPDWQLDLSGARGLTHETPRWQLGMGLSLRY